MNAQQATDKKSKDQTYIQIPPIEEVIRGINSITNTSAQVSLHLHLNRLIRSLNTLLH